MAFFFNSLKRGHYRNFIGSLSLGDGTLILDKEDIHHEVVCHFKDQFTTIMTFGPRNIKAIRLAINSGLSNEQCLVLSQDITEQEIKDTLFSLARNKAPGLE